MDPMQPIEGVALDKYAELCAKMKDTGGDADACARIAEENGVSRQAWEAAQKGWNARMADPTTAGTVAVAYMPLYQDALAKFGGPVAEASFEDYVKMTAMINTGDKSLDKMYARFDIDPIKWSQISTHWVDKLAKDPQLGAKFSVAVQEEIKRLNE